jgi:hypothetical protein
MNFMAKNSVNLCKPVLSLPALSRVEVSNGSVSKNQRPLYKCRAASTNSPFFAKQTQFITAKRSEDGSHVLLLQEDTQNLHFCRKPKTNPKQTQSNPNLGNMGYFLEFGYIGGLLCLVVLFLFEISNFLGVFRH